MSEDAFRASRSFRSVRISWNLHAAAARRSSCSNSKRWSFELRSRKMPLEIRFSKLS